MRPAVPRGPEKDTLFRELDHFPGEDLAAQFDDIEFIDLGRKLHCNLTNNAYIIA